MRRGEIYFIDLNPVIGREQAGVRPVVVISVDAINSAPLVVTVMIGTKGARITRDYPSNVRVPAQEGGLPEETVFLGFQVRSVDHNRFRSAALGKLSSMYMRAIDTALRYCLGL
jgi:mRNA interferase MazF